MTKKTTHFNKNNQAGFTLLEVLIALLIAAIVVSVPILVFKDNEAAKLKNKAYQLIGLLQVAQEESIFRGVEVGLRLEREKYYFMLYDGNKWQPLQEHKLLKEVRLEEPLEMYINIDGQESLLENVEPNESENDSEKDDGSNEGATQEEQAEQNIEQAKKYETPQIYMLSSGEMNDFTLTLGVDRDDPIFYRIKGNYLGEMKLSKLIDGHYRHDWDIDIEEKSSQD